MKYTLNKEQEELIEFENGERITIFNVYRGMRYYDWVAIEEAKHEREVLDSLSPELRKAYLRLTDG